MIGSQNTTAAAAGFASCHTCYLLVSSDEGRCPRCHSGVHVRMPNSLHRTMALLVTAIILYVPANVLPIMSTTVMGNPVNNTIMGGVITLWKMGSYPIAAIIFIASVFVPVAKLVSIAVLCWAAKYGSSDPKKQAVLYRVTELIGKWSMIDVFVVAVLVALIKLGDVLSFYPGLAALTFAGVVILTMTAAENFDPRLIWDKAETSVGERMGKDE